MTQTELEEIVRKHVMIFAGQMRNDMLLERPRHDFLQARRDDADILKDAAKTCATHLTDWRGKFLTSAAGKALCDALGEDARVTLYADERLSLRINGLKTGRDAPRFHALELTDAKVQPIAIRGVDDLVEFLPATFIFDACRHLTSHDAAKFVIESIRASLA